MLTPLHVLILEGRPSDAERMLHELRQSGFAPEGRVVTTEEEFLACLIPGLDVILGDHSLPQFTSLQALQLLQARGLDVPLIVVSGAAGEEEAVECMRLGAADYLRKGRLAGLGPAVAHAMERTVARRERGLAAEAEQKQALAALRESEERYRALYDRSLDCIYVHDLQGRFIDANDAALRLLGYERDEIHGLSLEALLTPDQLQEAYEGIREVAETGTQKRASGFRLRCKNGGYVDVETKAAVILRDGRPVAIQGIARDVTERKQAEREMQHLASFPRLNPNPVLEVSLAGEVTFCNDAGVRMARDQGLDGPEGLLPGDIAEALRALEHGEVTQVGREVLVGCRTLYATLYSVAGLGAARVYMVDITERKQAETALQDSELRYRRLFEAAKDGILILEAETGTIIDANPFLTDLLGYPREELLGKELWEVGLFEDVAESKEAFRELQRTGYSRYENLPLESRDGRRTEVEFVSNVYQMASANVIQCNIRNIAERKMQDVRRELAMQVLATLNKSHETPTLIKDILLLISAATGVEAVGIRLREGDDYPYYETKGFAASFVEAERHLCSRDEAGEILRDEAGDPLLECMCGNVIRGRVDPSLPCFTEHGSFWTNCTSELPASAFENDRRWRTRNRCNRSGYESVALVPLRAGDEVIGLLQMNDHRRGMFAPEAIRFFEQLGAGVGIALARRLAAEELGRANALMAAQSEASLDGILVVSASGQILSSNGRFAQMWGIPPDVMELRSDERALQAVLEKLADPQEFMARVRDVYDHPEGSSRDEVLLRDGSVVERHSAPVPGSEGEDNGWVWYFRDITERKRADEERVLLESRLRHGQKLESIGTLASGVAHEINNPISGVMNYAQLILDAVEPGSPLREYAGEIVKESERVAVIVRNLLQFARHEKESHSPARVKDIVEQTVSLIRAIMRHDQITLEVDVPENLPTIKCRSQQVQQVLMNLLTNARDALNARYPGHDDNKVVCVTTGAFHREGRQWVRVTVEDHGCGMAPEVQGQVFDPFFTTKPRDLGTGLGLSISHSIAREHHGELRFETQPGEWTRFHLDLPVDNGWDLAPEE